MRSLLIFVAAAAVAVLFIASTFAAATSITSGGIKHSNCEHYGPGADWRATIGFATVSACETFVSHLTITTGPSTSLFGYPQCSAAVFCLSGKDDDKNWWVTNSNADMFNFISIVSVRDSSTGPNMALTVDQHGWDLPCPENVCKNLSFNKALVTCNNGPGGCLLEGVITNVNSPGGGDFISLAPAIPEPKTTPSP